MLWHITPVYVYIISQSGISLPTDTIYFFSVLPRVLALKGQLPGRSPYREQRFVYSCTNAIAFFTITK